MLNEFPIKAKRASFYISLDEVDLFFAIHDGILSALFDNGFVLCQGWQSLDEHECMLLVYVVGSFNAMIKDELREATLVDLGQQLQLWDVDMVTRGFPKGFEFLLWETFKAINKGDYEYTCIWLLS